MTVAIVVAAVTPAGPEGKHGSYVDADEEFHRRETIAAVAAVAAAAAACHHRETSVAAAAAAAACHRRETSFAAATAAAACHLGDIPYRRLCRRPFVGLRTSYTTLTCLLLLELAALQ